MGIIRIIALIGGIGLLIFLVPYIAGAFNSSDSQIIDKANSRQEVQAFQERFGPISPQLDRQGCCTYYIYYIANRTYYYQHPYDPSQGQVQATRFLQLSTLFDGWVTKVSMVCGGDMEPSPLEPDVLTIRATDCLDKGLPTNSSG